MGEQDAAFIKNMPDNVKKYFGVPGKRVRISKPFYLSKTEITYAQYDYSVEIRRREGQSIDSPETATGGRGKQPVVFVSWFEAAAYADWLGKLTNNQCRLPTEAEWEYAARAGTSTAYPWGNKIGVNNANCDGCGSPWDGKQAAPVGSFATNRFGLHDMPGNVFEWTCSNWHDLFDGSEQQCNDDATDNTDRVLRGGSWNYNPDYLRASYRFSSHPDNRYNFIGFRVLCLSPIE